MVCSCVITDPHAFKNLREEDDQDGERWWVHIICGKPREKWLRSLGDVMLNYFRGGELDGKAYATSTLLEHQELMDGYRWTSEVITSKITGATARVWRHHDLDEFEVYTPNQDQDDLVTERQEERPMPTIEERRIELGVSRQKLADEAGMTHAKIYRIGHDGVRTTEEERRVVNEALDRIQAKRESANPQ